MGGGRGVDDGRQTGWLAAVVLSLLVALVTTLTPQIRQQTRPTSQLVGDIVVQKLPHLAAEMGIEDLAPRFACHLQPLQCLPGRVGQGPLLAMP